MTSEVGSSPAPTRIDGKYEVLRELSRGPRVTLYEVRAAESAGSATRVVSWFEVGTPAERQAFHTYRSALRDLAPAGLTDVVARPGAFYAVWQQVPGVPLSAYLEQKTARSEETVEAVRALEGRLAAHGYALSDAEVLVDGREVRVGTLHALPTPRTPEDIAARNAALLEPLRGGRVRRKPQPGAWLSFVPGLALLSGAGYLGAQAAQIYLNPPVREVGAVTGLEARSAARKLTAQGYRVEYTEGQAAAQGIGTIIRQDPAAGTDLPLGRLVVLTVNNPPAIEVPRLEEMSLDQAKDALKDRAMVLGKVVKVDGSLTKTPEGRIVAQLPEAAATAQRGQPVQVMVSTGLRGRETWLGPLEGMTLQQAREHAKAAGLIVTEVKEQPSDQPEGTVLDQSPAQYVRVEVGSPAVLTVAVARYSAPSRPTDALPLPPAPPQPEPEPQPEPAQPASPEPTPPATEETPEGSAAEPTPEPQPAQPEPPAAELAPEPASPRSVTLNYTFPADLPPGTYSIVVRDDNGEQPVLTDYDASRLAGQAATSTQTVTGNAIFIIRRDGQDYETVAP